MINKNSKDVNKTWVIYKHTCKVNGFSYIGQTAAYSPEYRWGTTGIRYKGNTIFWKAILEFGWCNFSHEILESDIKTLAEANEREKYWISLYHTWIGDPDCKGYNTMRGGGNNWYIASDETRAKMSAAKIGKQHSEEYKRKMSKLLGGREVICIETGTSFFDSEEAERQTGIRHILECCHHQRQVAGGYHWAFIDDLTWQTKFSEFKGKPRHITKLAKRKIMCVETEEIFQSIKAAVDKYHCCITKVLSGERELAGGYHWRYVDD